MSNNYSNYKPKIPKKPEGEFAIPPQNYPDNMPSSFCKGQSPLHIDRDLALEYKNYHGETVFWVKRQEATRGSKKKFIPFSYIGKKNKDIGTVYTWQPKGWPKDRVLFGEDLLRNNNKPVIVLEGEKAANAARKIFKDHVCISWSGGSNSVFLTNFKRLKDKKVILWPDNDEDGLVAMHEVARTLILEDITEDIQLVELEKFELPKGWDVADEIKNEWITPQAILNNKTEYKKEDEIWEQLEELEDKRKVDDKQVELTENYVYVRDRTDLFEKNTYKFVTQTQCNEWYLHITKKGPKMWTALLANPNLPKVHNYLTHAGLEPGIVEIKDRQFPGVQPGTYLNNFRGSSLLAKKGDCQFILDYYKWLLGDDNWTIVEQLIAFFFKHPGKKMLWCPVFVSEEGGGKGLLASLLEAMLGDNNVDTNCSVDMLTNIHSTVIEGKQLIVLNEVDSDSGNKDRKINTNRLKPYITDHTININPKNKPIIKIPNFCNFFIFSNLDNCLHLREDTRRYMVMKVKHTQEEVKQKLEKNGLGDSIVEAIHGEGASYLKYHFEKNVTIPNEKMFFSHAPRTADLEQMIQDSRPTIHRMLDEALEAQTWPFEQYDTFWTAHEPQTPYSYDEKLKKQIKNPIRYTSYTQFTGMVIARELYQLVSNDLEFKKEYITQDLIIDWCKEKSIKWPNGDTTRQIILDQRADRLNNAITKPRAYLIKDREIALIAEQQDIKKYISKMTQGELGKVYGTFSYSYMTYDDRQHRWDSKEAVGATGDDRKYLSDKILKRRIISL